MTSTNTAPSFSWSGTHGHPALSFFSLPESLTCANFDRMWTMTDGLNPLGRNAFGEPNSVVPQRVSDTALIHFAGLDIQVGPFLRQRCAWCGAVLADENLDRISRHGVVPVGQDPKWGLAWPVSALVCVDGSESRVVKHVDGDQLPPGTCADIDPSVTL